MPPNDDWLLKRPAVAVGTSIQRLTLAALIACTLMMTLLVTHSHAAAIPPGSMAAGAQNPFGQFHPGLQAASPRDGGVAGHGYFLGGAIEPAPVAQITPAPPDITTATAFHRLGKATPAPVARPLIGVVMALFVLMSILTTLLWRRSLGDAATAWNRRNDQASGAHSTKRVKGRFSAS